MSEISASGATTSTSGGISEAEYDRSVASFWGNAQAEGGGAGRGPTPTVESVRTLTAEERYDVRAAAHFGNEIKVAGMDVTTALVSALDECERQERAIPGLSVPLSDAQESEARRLLAELAEAAETRLAMSADRSRVYAQAELMRWQATCGTADGLMSDLRRGVKHLQETRPLAGGR